MQTEILTAPVTVCHNRLVEAVLCLPPAEHGRWCGGSYGETKNDGLGVNNKEESACNIAARETMKTSIEKIWDMRKKKKQKREKLTELVL